MKGVIKRKNIKFIKICLISPITEIVINVVFILSFLVMFILFFAQDKNFNNYQISEITKNYLNYDNFSEIKNSEDFESYLQSLLTKLYTINPSKDSIPKIIPMGPIRLSQFSNNPNDCSKLDNLESCHKNFSCIIDSLTEIYSYKCDKIFYGTKNDDDDADDKLNKKINIPFSEFVPKLSGFYSEYDIIKERKYIDITIGNYKDEKKIKVQNLIKDRYLKLLLIQINFKLNSNHSYLNVLMGIEMTNYYRNVKKIFNISLFNNNFPNNLIFIIFECLFDITVTLEIIKLIYEVNVKLMWSVHPFVFINVFVSVIFIIFNIIELYARKSLNLDIDMNSFNCFLPYIHIKKINKILYSILFFFLPFKIISLLSWWKTISEPLIKLLHVFFRMFPGIIITAILFLTFASSFIFVNYFLFNDIFPQFQSLYDSFLFIFCSNKMQFLYKEKPIKNLVHNLSNSQYIIFFIFYEIFFIYIALIILVSAFVFFFKKANIIETPKVENEYMTKLKQIEVKLEKKESLEDTDLKKLPKQILWINLSLKNGLFKEFSKKYDLLLFQNSNQIISFIKYLLAVKPELQFQKLFKKFNIIIQLNDDNLITEKELDIIYYLADWLVYVGCKIPICVFSENILSSSVRMKLLKAYKYIYFINNSFKLDNFISEKYEINTFTINSNSFNFIPDKNGIVGEDDENDSDSTLINRVKMNSKPKMGKRMTLGVQRTLIPYSTLNLKNNYNI